MHPEDMLPDEPKYKPYKAIIAAVGTLAAIVVAALADGEITTAEWITIVPAVGVVGGLVYAVRNPPVG